jgi:hypothetical protein
LGKETKIFPLDSVPLGTDRALPPGPPGFPFLKTQYPVFQDVPAKNGHREAVFEGQKVPGMNITEPAGGAVDFPKTPVRNMFKKHVVDILFRPVCHDAAERTARLGGGFLEFKKIDVPVYPHYDTLTSMGVSTFGLTAFGT